jgi:hypothetical protein
MPSKRKNNVEISVAGTVKKMKIQAEARAEEPASLVQVSGSTDEERIADMRSKEALILASKTNANLIVALLQIVQDSSSSVEVAICGTQSLRRVFAHFEASKDLTFSKSDASPAKATAVFRTWLKQQFKSFVDVIYAGVSHVDARMQVQYVY